MDNTETIPLRPTSKANPTWPATATFATPMPKNMPPNCSKILAINMAEIS